MENKFFILFIIFLLGNKVYSCDIVEELNRLNSTETIKKKLDATQQTSNRIHHYLRLGFEEILPSFEQLNEFEKTECNTALLQKVAHDATLSKAMKEELDQTASKSKYFIDECKKNPKNQIQKIENCAKEIGTKDYEIEKHLLITLPQSLFFELMKSSKVNTNIEINKIKANISAIRKNSTTELIHIVNNCKESNFDCHNAISNILRKTLNGLILQYALLSKLRHKLTT